MGENELQLEKTESKYIKQDIVNVSGSVIGALVGLALAGPIGAVLGATTSPILTMTYNVIDRAIERRYERANNIVTQALYYASLTPQKAIELLNNSNKKTDEFIRLLRMTVDLDPGLDRTFSAILGNSLVTENEKDSERLSILGDAIRNMRLIHLQILKEISNAGGTLKAKKISTNIGIPEIELRSVVRDLELKGMIKDCGVHPIKWKIRELGSAIVNFTNKK